MDIPRDPVQHSGPSKTPLERFNANRASLGMRVLDADEANHRNELLRDLDAADRPGDRERIRDAIAKIDRPEDLRDARKRSLAEIAPTRTTRVVEPTPEPDPPPPPPDPADDFPF